MEGIEALVSDLRAERPEPEPRFEAELDAWAAAGFPRGERPGARAAGGGSGAGSTGFLGRFRSGGSRGWAPVAATAAAVVVVGVSISQVADFGGGDESLTGGATQEAAGEGADVAEGPRAAPSAAEHGGRRGRAPARSGRRSPRAASDQRSRTAAPICLARTTRASGYNLADDGRAARAALPSRSAGQRRQRQPRPGEAPRRARRSAHAGRPGGRGRRRERPGDRSCPRAPTESS